MPGPVTHAARRTPVVITLPAFDPYPVAAVRRAQALLGYSAVTIDGMRTTGDLTALTTVRTRLMAAVRLLSTGTNVGVHGHAALSAALSSALDAVAALDKAASVLQFVDSGIAQSLSVRSLGRAARLASRAIDQSRGGLLP